MFHQGKNNTICPVDNISDPTLLGLRSVPDCCRHSSKHMNKNGVTRECPKTLSGDSNVTPLKREFTVDEVFKRFLGRDGLGYCYVTTVVHIFGKHISL